jgi:excisionase family DNA binding protein
LASYLNIREAPQYMGISPHTLYKLVERNEVPAAKVGGSWRLSPAAHDDFLDAKPPVRP